jgi:hypothetical protein
MRKKNFNSHGWTVAELEELACLGDLHAFAKEIPGTLGSSMRSGVLHLCLTVASVSGRQAPA